MLELLLDMIGDNGPTGMFLDKSLYSEKGEIT